jgi:hypothetical protein
MSEKPEKELYDLVELNMATEPKCIITLEKFIKQSLIDCNAEIVYGNGKTVKIKDLFDTLNLARDLYNRLHFLYSSELTCKIKKPITN